MITKFGSLFAGHIDLDNIGWEGTPVNDRFYSNDQLVTVFDKTIAMATLMDRAENGAAQATIQLHGNVDSGSGMGVNQRHGRLALHGTGASHTVGPPGR